MTELGIVEGEYPGYKFNADCFNPIKDVTPVPSLEEAGDPVEGRVWFISNPSAIDGNWQDTEVLQRFIEAGHEVVLDYAYAGLTIDVPDAEPIDLSAPNIKAILTSPSKIFGVFNHRYTGVAYTREWIGPLYDTQTWFRGVPAMLDTPMLYETFRPHELPRKYQERQLKICQALADLIGQEVRPSDAILTATIDGPFPAEPGTFHGKAQTPQIRLSRLFEKLEKL
jgi:histidinol-phosphate/aromatic aminotransferase/cobyric acid decarboxylase-like protein